MKSRKFITALAFACIALLLGVYQLIYHDGRHNIFIGVFWIVYGIVGLLSLPKRTKDA